MYVSLTCVVGCDGGGVMGVAVVVGTTVVVVEVEVVVVGSVGVGGTKVTSKFVTDVTSRFGRSAGGGTPLSWDNFGRLFIFMACFVPSLVVWWWVLL